MNQRSSLMEGRPPLAVSPRRLRPRRATRSTTSTSTSTTSTIQTPPACSKTQIPTRSPASGKSLPRPEYQLISSELMALAKRAEVEFGNATDISAALASSITANTSPLFERGRFYEEYSARRNERLKRKKGEITEEMVAQDPSVAVELGKRRNAKKAESVRKSVPANFSASRASSLRSSLRSSKEMKKPYASGTAERPSFDGGRRIGTRSVRKL